MKNNKKTFWIGGIVISILLLIVLAVALGTDYIIEPYLKKNIRGKVQKFAAVEYKVSFDDMDLQSFGGDIFFKNLEIIPIKNQDSLKVDSYHFLIDELVIEGMDVFDYFFENKFDINEVRLDSCNLALYRYLKTGKIEDISDTTEKIEIESIEIKSFIINYGTLRIIDVTEKGKSTFAESDINLNARKIKYVYGDDLVESFSYGNVRSTLTKAKAKSPDSLRLFAAEKIEINGNRGSHVAKINNVTLTTRASKYKLAGIVGHEADWIKLQIPAVRIENWKLTPLLLKQSFYASQVEIIKPDFFIFRDKRPPFPEKPDAMLPTDFIRDWKYKFAIDSVLIKRGKITYQEHVQNIEKPGHITFSGLYATIYNMTNDSEMIKQNGKKTTVYTKSEVMDVVPLKADFTFSLQPGKKHHVKGSLGKVNLTTFNPMISKVGYVNIKNGICHNMEFEFTYGNNSSSGKMSFKYDNLEIETISMDDGDDDSFGQNIKSFLADFAIDDENLDDKFREGTIEFERNKKKSIVNFWWKSLLTGIKSSIGLKGEVKKNTD